jgi:hypothetical protein
VRQRGQACCVWFHVVARVGGAGRKEFFFEKKKQKTFSDWAEASRENSAQTRKSFLVLFFKKEPLS